MVDIFLKTIPFFALIALGWGAGRAGFFTREATAWLTKFVFYFALSAMLFRLAASLNFRDLFDLRFVAAYILGSSTIWLLGFSVARAKGRPVAEAAMEAQTGITGNTGFLGVPLLVALIGERAVGPLLLVLTIDMVVFSTAITLLISSAREGRFTLSRVPQLLLSVARNPMIVSMVLGLGWSFLDIPLWQPIVEFLTLLGGASTPGALFAIGASLAATVPDRPVPALWLSFEKLVLHPAAVAVSALLLFHVDRFPATVMIAAAALPVAGNLYMLAQYFQVAVRRVSTAILLSTIGSIVTFPVVIHWILQG